MKLSRIFKMLLVLVVLLTLTLGSSIRQAEASSSPSVRGGVVVATTTYSGIPGADTVKGVDFYLSSEDANIYAIDLLRGYSTDIGLDLLGRFPGLSRLTGILSIADILNTVSKNQTVAEILLLSTKGKKVHVHVSNGNYGISEWDGKESSIKTSMPEDFSHGGAIIETMIDLRDIDYY